MNSSALVVRHLAAGQLQVVAPPKLGLVVLFGLISLIPAVYFLYRAVRVASLWPLMGILLFSLPFGIAALAVHRSGSLLLDKSANLATITSPSWFWHKTQSIPLGDLQYAQLRFTRNGTWIALVLQDGSATSFSDSSDQAGQGSAAQAINDYLGVPRR